MDPTDPLRNPADPMHKSGPDLGIKLFREFGKLIDGMPYDAVVNAASNVLINAVRQGAPDWRRAEIAFDEAFGRAKQVLKNHYDSTGRLKGVFPFDQVIMPEAVVDKSKFYS